MVIDAGQFKVTDGGTMPEGPATPGVQQQLGYDSADRPEGGYVYDLFGRQTTIPADDAPNPGGGNVTLGYFDSDLPAAITQGATSTVFTLDVAQRRLVQSTTTAGQTTTTTRHYTDSTDDPSWIDVKTPDGQTTTTRYASSISGDLGAAITGDGTASLKLPTMHGDVATTVPIPATAKTSDPATTISGWATYTEYGSPTDPAQAKTVRSPAGYGWLGAKERSTTDATAGLTLMGVRIYSSPTGSFSSLDPIAGANATGYSHPSDPVNSCDTDGKARCRVRTGHNNNVVLSKTPSRKINYHANKLEVFLLNSLKYAVIATLLAIAPAMVAGLGEGVIMGRLASMGSTLGRVGKHAIGLAGGASVNILDAWTTKWHIDSRNKICLDGNWVYYNETDSYRQSYGRIQVNVGPLSRTFLIHGYVDKSIQIW